MLDVQIFQAICRNLLVLVDKRSREGLRLYEALDVGFGQDMKQRGSAGGK